MSARRDTPAMKQYRRFKEQHPGCIVFFRMGDFYELFEDDAVTAHKALGITLTQRTEGVPMAGVPHHSVEGYIRRMIDQGFRVAIGDQIQDPKEAKGVVERAVTRVITPGTLVDDTLLDADASNYLGAIAFLGPGDGETGSASVGVVELSTGEFVIAAVPASSARDWLAAYGVRELLVCATAIDEADERAARVAEALGIAPTPRPAWQFRADEALGAIRDHFGVAGTEGYGIDTDDPALVAAGVLVRYLRETQALDSEALRGAGGPATSNEALQRLAERTLAHVRPPRLDHPSSALVIDAVSLRALEVERTVKAGTVDGSLLSVFSLRGDGCDTPMGRRLLREWLCRPLADLEAIEGRQACVSALHSDEALSAAIRAALDSVQDIPRMVARVGLGRATPRDLVGVGRSLGRIDAVVSATAGSPAFAEAHARLESMARALGPIAADLQDRCVDDPPAHLRDGGLVRDGVDAELDEARELERNSHDWLAKYQASLVAEHDLPSLKVGFNKVFGYYIELPAAQARRAPQAFTRKQTLKNAERYITPELKAFEEKVLSAGERAIAREQRLFTEMCRSVAEVTEVALRFSSTIAAIDALGCLARRAIRAGWTRPEMVDDVTLEVRDARHPVLEEVLGDRYVANDVCLGACGEHADDEEARGARLALITGPNMSGKSTYIRQAALIVLLAHVGSYVPAASARVGLTDRVFTRIGADDALHAGQSTFMVEMIETANILHHATERSLVVLDEIGRGTSTLDGLSLAWAIAEHLAGEGESLSGPRAMFATHYHELTTLPERLPGRVRNLHVEVREWGEEIVFLHRIMPGAASRSYGIHVARLAGLPTSVVQRARAVMDSLSVSGAGLGKADAGAVPSSGGRATGAGTASGGIAKEQMTLFTEYLPHPAVEALHALDLDRMSPMQAFETLRSLRDELQGG